MFAGHDRGQTRAVFFHAWQRYRSGEALVGVEQTIVRVVQQHPEYHTLLEQPEAHRDRDYSPESGETNPFLHLGLHISIEEQLSLDQPQGIRGYYQKMLQQLPDEHAVQHRMMECLSEMLWQAGRAQSAPDETVYLNCLAQQAGKPGLFD